MSTLAGRGRAPNFGGRRTSRRNVTGANGTASPTTIPLPGRLVAEYAFDPTTTFPQIITEISPSTDPLAVPAWSRIHDSHRGVNRLRAVNVRTGRAQAFAGAQPGTADHDFDNHDRVLDPDYNNGALSPYYGSLDAGNRIRDRVVWGSRIYDLFTGFVLGYPQVPRPPADGACPVSAVDLLDWLSGADMPSSAYAALISSEPGLRAWWRLGERSGTSAADSGPHGFDGDYRGSPTLGVAGLIASDGDTAVTFGSGSHIDLPGSAGVTGTSFAVVALVTHAATTGSPEGIYHQIGLQGTTSALSIPFSLSYYNQVNVDMNGDGTVGFAVDNNQLAGDIDLASAASVISTARIDDGQPHLIVAFRAGQRIGLIIDNVVAGYATLALNNTLKCDYVTIGAHHDSSGAITFPLTGTIDEVSLHDNGLDVDAADRLYQAWTADWTADTTGARTNRLLDLAGVAPTERAVDIGAITLGPATLTETQLSYAALLEATEQGRFYIDHPAGGIATFHGRYWPITNRRSTTPQAVFTDDPNTTTGYRYEPDNFTVTRDRQLVRNEIKVSWVGGTVTSTDLTSRRKYGKRSLSITTELQTVDQARSVADWYLQHYKNAVRRILSLTLRPSADKRLFDIIFDLRETDRITVANLPQNIGARWTQDFIIEGKQIHIATGVNDCTCVLYLSNVDTQSYFILDSSLLDGTDVLA